MSLAIIYSSDFLSSINSNTVSYVEKMIDDINMQISWKDVLFYEVKVYQFLFFILFHSYLSVEGIIISNIKKKNYRMSLGVFFLHNI